MIISLKAMMYLVSSRSLSIRITGEYGGEVGLCGTCWAALVGRGALVGGTCLASVVGDGVGITVGGACWTTLVTETPRGTNSLRGIGQWVALSDNSG